MVQGMRHDGIKEDFVLPVAEINVGDRFRKDFGDLTELTTSIREVGLLHPVVVNSKLELLAGARRLEACKSLGWTKIPARLFDVTESLRIQHDENTCRMDLKPSEAAALAEKWLPLEKELAKKHRVKLPKLAENQEEPKADLRDTVAARVGMGRESLRKAQEVVKAAEKDPGCADLVEKMDASRKVDSAYQELKVRQGKKKVKVPKPVEPEEPKPRLRFQTETGGVERALGLIMQAAEVVREVREAFNVSEASKNRLTGAVELLTTAIEGTKDFAAFEK